MSSWGNLDMSLWDSGRRAQVLGGILASLEWQCFSKLWKSFGRPGAKLGEAVQVRLAAVDERLATLSTALWQNVLAPARDPALVLEANEELAGLPTSLIAAMSAATQTITW